MVAVATRTELVIALASCVAGRRRTRARRFLEGLSTGELQYIAEFLGARIIEESSPAWPGHCELAAGIALFDSFRRRPNEHRMLVLLEYISTCA